PRAPAGQSRPTHRRTPPRERNRAAALDPASRFLDPKAHPAAGRRPPIALSSSSSIPPEPADPARAGVDDQQAARGPADASADWTYPAFTDQLRRALGARGNSVMIVSRFSVVLTSVLSLALVGQAAAQSAISADPGLANRMHGHVAFLADDALEGREASTRG